MSSLFQYFSQALLLASKPVGYFILKCTNNYCAVVAEIIKYFYLLQVIPLILLLFTQCTDSFGDIADVQNPTMFIFTLFVKDHVYTLNYMMKFRN